MLAPGSIFRIGVKYLQATPGLVVVVIHRH